MAGMIEDFDNAIEISGVNNSTVKPSDVEDPIRGYVGNRGQIELNGQYRGYAKEFENQVGEGSVIEVNATHGTSVRESYLLDEDNDGISDMFDWIFSNYGEEQQNSAKNETNNETKNEQVNISELTINNNNRNDTSAFWSAQKDKEILDQKQWEEIKKKAETSAYWSAYMDKKVTEVYTNIRDVAKEEGLDIKGKTASELLSELAEKYDVEITGNGNKKVDIDQSKYNQLLYGDVLLGKGGESNIQSGGCFVSSYALMASIAMGEEILPDKLLNTIFPEINNYYKLGEGTGQEALYNQEYNDRVNLKFEEKCDWGEAWNEKKLMKALEEGKLVMWRTKDENFTKGGHWLLLTGLTDDGNIQIFDPNGANWNKSNLKDGFENGFDPNWMRQRTGSYYVFDIKNPNLAGGKSNRPMSEVFDEVMANMKEKPKEPVVEEQKQEEVDKNSGGDSPNIQSKNNSDIAHRGYHPGGIWENSTDAFTAAGEQGFWGCEVDVRFDANGNLVCSHNAVKNGENPPTLEEYLDICKEYGMNAIIDLKYENGPNVADANLSPAILETIKEKGMIDSCILQTDNTLDISYIRENSEDARIWFLNVAENLSDKDLELIKENNIECVNFRVGSDQKNATKIKELTENGIDACVWSVTKEETKEKLLNMGAKYVMSDEALGTTPFKEGDEDFNNVTKTAEESEILTENPKDNNRIDTSAYWSAQNDKNNMEIYAKIRNVAKELGINVDGKTAEEILKELTKKYDVTNDTDLTNIKPKWESGYLDYNSGILDWNDGTNQIRETWCNYDIRTSDALKFTILKLGKDEGYWVREDSAQMFGNKVCIASDIGAWFGSTEGAIYKPGDTQDSSLGTGIVMDLCGMAVQARKGSLKNKDGQEIDVWLDIYAIPGNNGSEKSKSYTDINKYYQSNAGWEDFFKRYPYMMPKTPEPVKDWEEYFRDPEGYFKDSPSTNSENKTNSDNLASNEGDIGKQLEDLIETEIGDIEANLTNASMNSSINDSSKESTNNEWVWPTDSTLVTSHFGKRNTGIEGATTNHRGIDIQGGAANSIYAINKGEVIFAGWNGTGGKTIKIDHGNGYVSEYMHCSNIDVKVGDTVEAGQVIGNPGNTRDESQIPEMSAHLHFAVKYNGENIDPESLIYSNGEKEITV